MNEINQICQEISSFSKEENQSTEIFMNWVRSEHHKIEDPKAKSYSIIAELIAI